MILDDPSRRLPVLVGALLLCLASAWSQVISGNITGALRDPSGAAIPGADVSLVNMDTQITRKQSTDAAGNFTFVEVPPGRYRVSAAHQGFKSSVASDIELQIDQTARVDMTMQVGSVDESVTVTATAAMLQTDTATMGAVIGQQQASDLPLNGRNFLQLATLSAGSVPATANTSASSRLGRTTLTVHVGGGRASGNSFLLDGIEMRGARFGEISVLPSPDVIKEFKIQQNNFSAEYGDSPGIISVFTKSGANQIHGAAYEFIRNSDLDARTIFDGPHPAPFKQNQFGADAGGAIISNQTFFFGGYDGQQIRQSTTAFATVPNPQWLTGNFVGYTGTLKDPLNNNAPFGGNLIPPGRISKIATAFNQYIPAPNTNSAQGNYTGQPDTSNNYNQYIGRIDHNFSSNDMLFARYLQSNWGIVNSGLLPYAGSEYPLNGKNAVVQETHIFSPTLVNSAKLGFSREYAAPENQLSSTDLSAQLGFLNTEVSPNDYSLPRFTLSGYTQMGHSQQTFHQWTNTYVLSDTLSLVKGKHTVSMGGDIRENRSPQSTTNGTNPRLTMNGTFSGNSVGDYLLGAFQTATIFDTLGNSDFRYSVYSLFVQDDYKVSKRLTLNLGVRWEYQQPWQILGGSAGYFDRSIPALLLQKPPSYFGLNVQAPFIQVGNVGNGVYQSQWLNFAPRFGFAYRASEKTVIRGGFGIFFAQNQGSWTIEEAANPGVAATLSYTNSAGKVPRLMDTLFDSPAVAVSSASSALSVIDPNRKNPYVEQWNLNVQRELPAGLILQVAYTGSAGRQLVGTEDVNQAVVNAPGQNLAVAARRPFPTFSNISTWYSGDNSSYNAMTVNVERRFAKGFSLLSNYTFSKSLDVGSGGNDDVYQVFPLNHHLDHALSDFDVRNRFVASAVWVLPVGHGQQYLGNAKGFVGGLVSGWQMNGILQIQSGLPFTVNETGDIANIGYVSTDERPNRVGSGVLSNPTAAKWIDTSAWQLQPAGTLGNSGRDVAFQEGSKTVDYSLFKNNYFGERNYNLQFRAEFFNILNNVNLGRPNTSVNGAAFGAVGATGPARQIQFALKFLF